MTRLDKYKGVLGLGEEPFDGSTTRSTSSKTLPTRRLDTFSHPFRVQRNDNERSEQQMRVLTTSVYNLKTESTNSGRHH